MSVRVSELELTRPVEDVWGMAGYRSARLLLRLDGEPLAWLHLDNPGGACRMDGGRLREAVAARCGHMLAARAAAYWTGLDTPTPATPPPPISVVVCSRDRADQLAQCLRRLRDLDYPQYELIVVDNASRDARTRETAMAHGARCVSEPRPGLDRARNRGLEAARYAIVAYTDDDALPDRGWLRAIAAVLEEPGVAAVTGPAFARELEHPAQRWFELAYGGMVQDLRRREFRRRTLSDDALLWSSAFGVGANMAFRRGALKAVGGFDPALDVGTPSGGGGDIELLHRLVAAGHTLVYAPSAFVWHQHRRSERALARQLYDNGRGFCAHLLTCARRGSVPPRKVLGFALRRWFGGWLLPRLRRSPGMPRRFARAELRGALAGPFCYLRARRAVRGQP